MADAAGSGQAPNLLVGGSPTGAEAVQAAHRDPAASMLLLTNIEKYALDPGYQEAARRQPKRKMSVLGRFLIFVVVAGLAWVSTVSALGLRAGFGQTTDPRVVLAGQVSEASARVAETEVKVEEARAVLRGAEVSEGASVALPLDVALASATSRVEGPGVVVKLEDGPSSASRSGIVRDTDLRTIMNLLWQAGAEAISIDGNRVGPGTTVRTAGSAILVNLNPVSSPYVIEALGDPAAMLEMLSTGAGAESMRDLEKSLGSSVSAVRQEKLTFSALPLQTLWSIDMETKDD